MLFSIGAGAEGGSVLCASATEEWRDADKAAEATGRRSLAPHLQEAAEEPPPRVRWVTVRPT